MRTLLAAAVACLTIVGLCYADASPASIRKTFNIPAQGLGVALQTLSKDEDVHVIFMLEDVKRLSTQGVSGEMTVDEALERLLKGTGLRYEHVDQETVTIVPIATVPSVKSKEVKEAMAANDKEAQKDPGFWGRFRVAQVDQGRDSQASSIESAEKSPLEEVVVTSHYEFLSVDTSGTTNLPLPIEKVPQSISLVSNDFIEAADLKTLSAIGEYTPGAINVGSPQNISSAIMLRGFLSTYAIDGINVGSVGSGVAYEPDYAVYDRLEIVKGPTSVVYGVASPGGVVNFVTKSATSQSKDYVSFQAGSWKSYRLEGQIAGALDAAGHVRAIGVVARDQGDSFIDFVNHANTVLYGGINFDLAESVTGYLHGGYERHERTSTDGIPTEPDGSPAPVARSFFTGLESSKYTTNAYHLESALTWHATDMLEFGFKGNYQTSNMTGDNGYASGLMSNGDVRLQAAKTLEDRNTSYGFGLSSIYRFDTLGLKNSFVSVDALYESSKNISDFLVPAGTTANIFAGESATNLALETSLAGPLHPFSQSNAYPTYTVSAQSVLQLTDPLSLLLGASYAKPSATVNTLGIVQDFRFSGQVSYRAGLTYEFLPGTNAYVSFSQSFYPQGLLAVGNTPLPPVIGTQYEGGLKYRFAEGRLLLTGALFQIKEKNLGQYDTTDTVTYFEYFKPIGEVTHKGLELQALGQITRQWQINAGYAYLDPKVTKDSNTAIIGQMELFLPKRTASVYSTYTLQSGFARGLSFGGGLRYVSAQRTSYDGSTKDIPGYTLVDATLGYTVDKWLVQLNAHNIFDKHYFLNTYQTLFYGNTVGDPASVALSVRRQF